MTDRELLEAAAKAAGISIVPCTCTNPRWPFKYDEAAMGKNGHWNPLINDGDALRLAVELGIDIVFRGHRHTVGKPAAFDVCCEGGIEEVRYGIVSAAASLASRGSE